jgi:hypothetical protein
VVLWSVIAIVVLVALGIFGTLIATGRVTLFPTPSATPTTIATAEPVVDTSYAVTVLNATTQSGLAGSSRRPSSRPAGRPTASPPATPAPRTSRPRRSSTPTPPKKGGAGLAQVIGGAA